MCPNALIVFAKNPMKGYVKTRIAQTAGDDKALEIYLKLLEHVSLMAQEVPADRFIYYSDHLEPDGYFPDEHFQKAVQQGEDLGLRMSNAIGEVLEKGYQKVVLIGSDCIEMQPGLVEEAFYSLTRHDIALGPTFDGGYYLIGMRRVHHALFRNMAWSTPMVCEETIKRVLQQELSLCQLAMMNDIDHEEDWENWCKRFEQDED